MGMSHRGRLNVLANVVGKSYEQIFREFEGELDPNVPQGSGDVKYHVGATGKFTRRVGRDRSASRSPRTRATSKRSTPSSKAWRAPSRTAAATSTHDHVLSVLIHGDAAFAGQGVVAETLNLSELPGYDVGGTVHIVVNNQVGFTTTPGFARSTVYATDIAKAVQAPIFHVNGDDPEAACASMRLAFEFRQRVQEGRRRRHGLLPALRAQRGRRARVHAAADVRGDRQAPLGPQALHRAAREPRRPHPRRGRAGARRLPRPARGRVRGDHDAVARAAAARVDSPSAPEPTRRRALDTGVPRDRLDADRRRARRPSRAGFEPHPKLARILGNRRKEFDDDHDRLGARRGARVRVAAARGHAGAPRRARTRGAARSASATRCSSTTTPKRSTRRSRTSAPTPRRS